MPRRWFNQRVIVRVCGLLVLGAVFTVAVAWGAAAPFWLLDRDYGRRSAATNEELQWWRATVLPAADKEPIEVARLERCLMGSDAVSMHWAREHSYSAAYRCRFGLPLRSLDYSTWMIHPDAPGAPGWHFSWHWRFGRPHHADTVYLPLTPIWSGFAIDTLFFATLAGVVLGGWRWMIRWRRVKRGLCPACKYPIGTSPVCTECGETLRASHHVRH